jgi:pimeloyl-ACP methyl ester carboxylesterase
MKQAADETRALAHLGFSELRRIGGDVEKVHRAISDRVFRAVGPPGLPAKIVHDTIAHGVYGGISGATALAGGAADLMLQRRPAAEGRTLSTSPGGSKVIAAINGLIGDKLEAEGSDLQEPMSIRVDGRVVAPTTDELAAAYPAATGRLVIFLHGWTLNEHSWSFGAEASGGSYGERLERDLGVTPVNIRYNTGRHISANGRSLDALLEALVAAWPVEVDEIALVGHSMGGLVARGAGYHGSERKAQWVSRVGDMVSIGSPHMGAPLEQGVHLATAALNLVPETQPLASFLRRRSAGVRDMRQGSLVDEDWQGRDPDALRAAVLKEVPLLDGVNHYFISATVTRSPRHLLGRIVGDSLVLKPSASGQSRARRIPFDEKAGLHVGGVHHIAMLNHPSIYDQLRAWLAGPQRRAPAVRGGPGS